MQATYIRNPEELAAAITLGTTPESLVLDFKRTINDWDVPRGTPDRVKAEAQKETCRDIAQFANTDGGCLLIGVAERLDPSKQMKVATAIDSVTDPDRMRQWIEEAIRNYLVPATFSHDTAINFDPRGTVLAVNVPPSLHLVALWDRQQHTIEYLRRTSHGKDWMNPDEAERHIMDGSRATRLGFVLALTEAQVKEVRLADGYWQRTGRPPETNLRRWLADAPVTVGRVDEHWFELEFRVGPATRSLILPFGVVKQAWVGADARVHVLLSVRAVHVYATNELMIEPYD